MVWLAKADGESILKICLFVSTEFTNVTDGWTNRQIDTASIRFVFFPAESAKSRKHDSVASCNRCNRHGLCHFSADDS